MAKVIALVLGLVTIFLLWFITNAELQRMQPESVELNSGSAGELQISGTAVSTSLSSPPTRETFPEVAEQVVDLPLTEWVWSDLRPVDLSPAADFGAAVALWEDTIVVGAPQGDHETGSVYVFNWNGREWHETARLTTTNGGSGFGRSLALDGERLVVGDVSNKGAVYIFYRQGDAWQEEAVLLPDGPDVMHFGHTVTIDGDTIAVGAPYRYQGEAINSGSVHLFEFNGSSWEHSARLQTHRSGPVLSDLFGWSVALQQDTLVVGAYLADQVHIYQRNGSEWLSETVWQGASGSRFGYAVAIDLPLVMAGAPHDSATEHQLGSASFLEWDKGLWEEKARVVPSEAHPGVQFGTAVALSGNVALAGMPGQRGLSDQDEAGAVSHWQSVNGVWVETAVLYAQEPSAGDQLGTAVAIGENIIVVGVPGDQNASGFTAVFMPEG